MSLRICNTTENVRCQDRVHDVVGTQMKITSGCGMSWHLSCVFKDEWAEMVREERTFQRKGKLTSEGTKEGKQKAGLPGVIPWIMVGMKG